MPNEVDIRALKEFAAAKFGPHSILRKVLAAEPDRLPAEELAGKVRTWLAILREDTA
jgi:hypothetical protein